MTTRSLPASPDPYPDELISSWIERVGLFYGVDYDDTVGILHTHGPNRVQNPHLDLDADRETAHLLCSWTGRNSGQIPALLDPIDRSIMGPPARVTYCASCWDEDCAAGRQPYIRANWVRWFSVHCPRHDVWLTARRPRLKIQSPLHPWINIWHSRPRWAQAYGCRYDADFAVGANGFSPETFAHPSGSWAEFTQDVHDVIEGSGGERTSPFAAGSLTALILSFEFAKLRRDVVAALHIAPPIQRLDDRDIICYPWSRPVWITERIGCLVMAVEYIRLLEGRSALFPAVAALVRDTECVSTQRTFLWQSH